MLLETEEALQEAISDATMSLKETLRVSGALDQKALHLSSLFTTLGTASIGTTVALLNNHSTALISYYTLLAMGATFLVGGIICLTCAFPRKLWDHGVPPEVWIRAERKEYSLHAFRGSKLRMFSKYLEENQRSNLQKIRRLRTGAYLAISAAPIAVLGYLTATIANLEPSMLFTKWIGSC